MKYAVGIYIVNISENDYILYRFLIYEDGTIFEFYGNYGSLRSHDKIDKNAALNIILNLEKYTYESAVKDIVVYDTLKNKELLTIAFYSEHIDVCCLLNNDLSDIFIERIISHDMIYSTEDSLKLFNEYKKYLM
jgi:hypothetical protein